MRWIIFLITLWTVRAAGGDLKTPDFSGYPRSAGFDYVLEGHRKASFMEIEGIPRPGANAAKPLLFVMSRFYRDSGGIFLLYFVGTTGYYANCRDVIRGSSSERLKGATQDARGEQLTPEQFTAFKEALRKLPDANFYPPLNQLVIVSFRDGDKWITRSLRPEDVKGIHGVLEERFETARPKP